MTLYALTPVLTAAFFYACWKLSAQKAQAEWLWDGLS
jgi:hypothetical protein